VAALRVPKLLLLSSGKRKSFAVDGSMLCVSVSGQPPWSVGPRWQLQWTFHDRDSGIAVL
jgi:hypothetical protein